MLLFPGQHSNIPQGPCEFPTEPWRTIVHGLGTTDTRPMIETLFKSLYCWWGNWAPVRSPRWFVAIQESECMSAHSAIPDLFPPLPDSLSLSLIIISSLHSVYSAIPLPHPNTQAQERVCTLECSIPWFKWFEFPSVFAFSRNCPCFNSQPQILPLEHLFLH